MIEHENQLNTDVKDVDHRSTEIKAGSGSKKGDSFTVGFFSARGRPARIACGLPRQLACNGAVAHHGLVGARLLTPHPRAPARCPQSAAPAARWLPSTKISPGPAAGASPSLSSARVRRTQPAAHPLGRAKVPSMTPLERPARPHTPGAPEPDRRLAAQDGSRQEQIGARADGQARSA